MVLLQTYEKHSNLCLPLFAQGMLMLITRFTQKLPVLLAKSILEQSGLTTETEIDAVAKLDTGSFHITNTE